MTHRCRRGEGQPNLWMVSTGRICINPTVDLGLILKFLPLENSQYGFRREHLITSSVWGEWRAYKTLFSLTWCVCVTHMLPVPPVLNSVCHPVEHRAAALWSVWSLLRHWWQLLEGGKVSSASQIDSVWQDNTNRLCQGWDWVMNTASAGGWHDGLQSNQQRRLFIYLFILSRPEGNWIFKGDSFILQSRTFGLQHGHLVKHLDGFNQTV